MSAIAPLLSTHIANGPRATFIPVRHGRRVLAERPIVQDKPRANGTRPLGGEKSTLSKRKREPKGNHYPLPALRTLLAIPESPASSPGKVFEDISLAEIIDEILSSAARHPPSDSAHVDPRWLFTTGE